MFPPSPGELANTRRLGLSSLHFLQLCWDLTDTQPLVGCVTRRSDSCVYSSQRDRHQRGGSHLLPVTYSPSLFCAGNIYQVLP